MGLKKQLADTVKWANKKFQALDENLEKEESESAKGRAHLKETIDAEKATAVRAIKDAVLAQSRGLMALKSETETKIKKTNRDVAAYGEQIAKHMAANVKTLSDKINAAKTATRTKLANADAASLARHEDALNSISTSLAAAKEENDKKFGEVYKKLGEDRADADRKLAAATKQLNDKLAAHAALEDTRFAKSVKNLEKAKKDTWADVTEARKFFTMGFAAVTSALKNSETRIQGDIQNVAEVVEGDKVLQARVNGKVKAELDRVLKLSNDNNSESKRARARVGELMNKNKVVAHQEIADLAKSANDRVAKMRSYQAKLRKEAAKDLTKATEALYEKLNEQQLEQNEHLNKLTHTLAVTKASTAAALKKTEAEFTTEYQLLVDTVSANHKSYENGLEELTGVAHNWKVSSEKDRELMKMEAKSMNADLNKAIVKAIQLGEAKAKSVLAHANANIGSVQRALSQEIG